MKYLYLIVIAITISACSEEKAVEDSNMDETKEMEAIHSEIKQFSEHVVAGDFKAVGAMYTADAKIFPNNLDIIKGQESITEYWDEPSDYKISYHKVTPEEIKITGNEAYDYGYYEGKSMDSLGTETPWKGKYVIIWKKVDKDWKIYLDIWNRIAE